MTYSESELAPPELTVSPSPPSRSRTGQILLWALVILSLALNGVLIYALNRARLSIAETLTTVRNTVAQVSSQPIVTTVSVDQEIPLNTTIPIHHALTVPLNIDYPLSTVVNTSFNVPLLGEQEISFPIETVIPIRYTLDVPIDMEFPISLTYHLQTEVPIEVTLPPELRAYLDAILAQAENSIRFQNLQ
ncbi:MAG: hypothetical protein JXA33_23195 [Anaerolineae bacterium]|nr:hypothetical protein [Anaerolineae bacterium]